MAQKRDSRSPSQAIRRGVRTFSLASLGVPKSPDPETGFSWEGHTLKHPATMPPLNRITSNGTTASQQFVKVDWSPEFAQNGVSMFRSILSQIGFSKAPGLGSLTMDLPTVGLPPLVYPALGLGMPTVDAPPFLPDIEVKSKHKKDPFGRKKWKQMRAVLDTGCTVGNWVSLETLDDLGIKEYNKLSPTETESLGVQPLNGQIVRPSGVVNLRWRGVPGPNARGNCARDFKMRFMVLDSSEPAPFQILIGSESIWKYRILAPPVLMAGKGRRDIVVLPIQKEPTNNSKLSHEERKAANEKLKAEKLKLKNKEENALKRQKEVEKDAGIDKKDDPQLSGNNSTTVKGNAAPKSKQSQNGPTLARSDSHHSHESASVRSQRKEAIERAESLANDAAKSLQSAT